MEKKYQEGNSKKDRHKGTTVDIITSPVKKDSCIEWKKGREKKTNKKKLVV